MDWTTAVWYPDGPNWDVSLGHGSRTFMITSRRILLRMTNISDKSCRENQNTHFVFSNSPPPKKMSFMRKLWKKYCRCGQATDDNITRGMRIACRIPKVSVTYSEYVLLITFPLWQWLHERASMIRSAFFACRVGSHSVIHEITP
jgi:hypothetical protein